MADPTITTTPEGTTVNGNFYANQGNSDSAFPSTPPADNLITTAGPATQSFNTYSNSLSDMISQLNGVTVPGAPNPNTPTLENTANDPYIQALNKIAETSSASTKALISSIQASKMNQENTINDQYDSYKKGLQLLGIQHNEAQSTPDLLMGHIQQASNEQQQKLQALDVEINKALMDAEKAQAENDLATLKEKMDYVDKLKEEQDNYLKKIADNLNAESSIAQTEAEQFYDSLQKLSPDDQEAFILELSKKYGISPTSIVKALADVKIAKDKAAAGTGGSKLSTSELKSIEDIYGVTLPYGTTEAEAEKILNDKGISTTPSKTPDEIKQTFSTGELYDMAIASGVEHKVNLSRQDEIDKFLTDDVISKLSALIDEGYSASEIIDAIKQYGIN